VVNTLDGGNKSGKQEYIQARKTNGVYDTGSSQLYAKRFAPEVRDNNHEIPSKKRRLDPPSTSRTTARQVVELDEIEEANSPDAIQIDLEDYPPPKIADGHPKLAESKHSRRLANGSTTSLSSHTIRGSTQETVGTKTPGPKPFQQDVDPDGRDSAQDADFTKVAKQQRKLDEMIESSPPTMSMSRMGPENVSKHFRQGSTKPGNDTTTPTKLASVRTKSYNPADSPDELHARPVSAGMPASRIRKPLHQRSGLLLADDIVGRPDCNSKRAASAAVSGHVHEFALQRFRTCKHPEAASYMFVIDMKGKTFSVEYADTQLSDSPIIAPRPLAKITSLMHGIDSSIICLHTSKSGIDPYQMFLDLESEKQMFDLMRLLQHNDSSIKVYERPRYEHGSTLFAVSNSV